MIRLILLVVLLGAVSAYFPDTRIWVLDKAEPLLTPFYRWQTKKEMTEIAQGLHDHQRENFGNLPDRRQFPRWLGANFNEEAAHDMWGGLYALEVRSDSFFVVSKGPDLVYRSDDDLRVGWGRGRSSR